MLLTNLQRNLKTALKVRGIDQKDICDKTGMSRAYLSNLMTKKDANPSLKIVEQIAKVLGVNAVDLLSEQHIDAIMDLPVGYKRILGILPNHKAFQVEKWSKETLKKLHP